MSDSPLHKTISKMVADEPITGLLALAGPVHESAPSSSKASPLGPSHQRASSFGFSNFLIGNLNLQHKKMTMLGGRDLSKPLSPPKAMRQLVIK